MSRKTALIIGAGPAGLTAAYELLKRTDIQPVILEMSQEIGGISRTVNYKGNRMDIGGHRFFSKSDRVMAWWREILPVQGRSGSAVELKYQGRQRSLELTEEGPDPERQDRVMLIRRRLSRILYGRRFFDYPIALNGRTVMNLGLLRMMRIGFSYLKARLLPIRDERTLEEFLINRFGKELYLTFFKDYTEKVWGVPCGEISAEWGAQRIKGLSITKALIHAVRSLRRRDTSLEQKDTETSLIERFLYPKYGPGQLWEEVARQVQEMGGEVRLGWQAVKLEVDGDRVVALTVRNPKSGATERLTGDYFFSTMPVKELVAAIGTAAPPEVQEVAEGLIYRDFITVGLLLKRLKVSNDTALETVNQLIPDNWIYVQEPDVRVGRLQIFNNWSPYMVKDPDTVWLGMEYFCTEGDELWSRPDPEFIALAIKELEQLGIIDAADVLDHTLIRVPKTYPAYFGSYDRFDEVRDYADGLSNLYLLGRNGMHRYNNADHSMLTAMVAVDNLVSGRSDKANIWAVNSESEYHEEAADAQQDGGATEAGDETGERGQAGERAPGEGA